MKAPIFARMILIGVGLCVSVRAEGLLPKEADISSSTVTSHHPLLIGEKVPEHLIVQDSSGTSRTLLSYKAPLEIMVLEILSPQCATDASLWSDLRRFYEAYKDWHVVFIALQSDRGTSPTDLRLVLATHGISAAVVRDESGRLPKFLGAKVTPELLLIDEGGILRYRGPLHDAVGTADKKPHVRFAQDAMNAMIGHVDVVPQAEPGGLVGCPIQ